MAYKDARTIDAKTASEGMVRSIRKDIEDTMRLRGISDPESLEGMDLVSEMAALHAMLLYRSVCADFGMESGLVAFVEAAADLKRRIDKDNALHGQKEMES